jgi:hypothetical protein
MADSEAPRMMPVDPALASPVDLGRWLLPDPALVRTLPDASSSRWRKNHDA